MSEPTTVTTILPIHVTTPRSGPRSTLFGEELRKLRNERGLTVLKAAVGIGINPSTLSRLERGYRGATSEIIKSVERFYQVSTVSE